MYTIYWSGSAVSNDLYSVHITAKYGVWFDHFLFLFMWFQLNKVIVSDDCTSTRKCVRRDGESVFEDLGVNERCHPSGMCGLKDGVRQCVCKDGYIGDGVNECKSKYSLLLSSVSDIIKVRIRYILSLFSELCGGKYLCHKNARCDNGICQCNRGLFGDGVTTCQGN